MDIKPDDETTLRQYLLGTLPESESSEIDQKLVTDEDFANTVETLEDEIVEDYLDGTLTKDETEAAERHFFRSPEHQRKLHFARLLRSQLRKEKPRPLPSPKYLSIRPALYWTASLAFASLLVLTGGLVVYTAKLRRTVEIEIAKNRTAQTGLQEDLAQERTKVAQLEDVLEKLKNQNGVGGAGQVSVTPVLLERDVGPIPQVSLGPEWMEIHIPIVDFGSPLSTATLKDSRGKVVWSSSRPTPAGRVLVLRVACKLLSPGQYYVILTSEETNQSLTYTFRLVLSR